MGLVPSCQKSELEIDKPVCITSRIVVYLPIVHSRRFLYDVHFDEYREPTERRAVAEKQSDVPLLKTTRHPSHRASFILLSQELASHTTRSVGQFADNHPGP